MSQNQERDLAFWNQRARSHGEASVAYGCNLKAMYWDNLLRARAIDRLVQIKPGMRILDVGTGMGYWAIRYAEMGALAVGLDFSRELLQLADARARHAGVSVTWLHGAIEEQDLPTLSAGFDVALSITCLQHITSPERQSQAVRRILQTLRPQGRFILLEDTKVAGRCRPINYILKHSQQEWIDLVGRQGGRFLRCRGVSFLRFPRGVPFALSACLDYLLGSVPYLTPLARVTAFAFAPK